MSIRTPSSSPLIRAMGLVDEALEIARRQACSRVRLPTPEELGELAELRDLMWMHHCATNAMLRSARLRLGIETDERSKPFEGDGPVSEWQKSLERYGLQAAAKRRESGEDKE
jgi:hypothetical protein